MAHPLHPALAHFPLAGWVFAGGADAGALFSGDPYWLKAALSLHAVALIAAAPTAFAGILDLGQLRRIPDATNIAMLHVLFVGSAFSASAASLVMRMRNPEILQEAIQSGTVVLSQWLSFGASASVLIAGFFGGLLVYRHGFGGRSETGEN